MSEQSNAMEKISLGVSDLEGVDHALVQESIVAKASFSTGHLIQLDCLTAVEEWSDVSDALGPLPSLCLVPALQ